MATPDIRSLYERYLQIMGGPGSSTEPTRSAPPAQSPSAAYELPSETYQASGGSRSTGGVLGALASPSPPWWVQALKPPGGAAIGPRRLSANRLDPLGRLPMPSGQEKIIEIPDPHIERFLPQSTRVFWTAMALVPGMLRDQLRGEQSNARAEEQHGASSSKLPPEPPGNRPGSQPPWILGPAILKEERERQPGRSNQGGRATQELDPNFRSLTRFLGSEGDQIVSESSVQTTGEEKPRTIPGIPLPDDHLDIPEFLRRRAAPEPTDINAERKRTDMPPGMSGGGSGNGGSGGGGGGGREWDEECKQERKNALKVCVDAFANGLRGDGLRWKSDYDVGPYQKPAGKPPWDVRDCMRGLMSEICYGNLYERPPEPQVKRYSLRARSPSKKKGR